MSEERPIVVGVFCLLLCEEFFNEAFCIFSLSKEKRKAFYIPKLKIICIISGTSISCYDSLWVAMIVQMYSGHTITG